MSHNDRTITAACVHVGEQRTCELTMLRDPAFVYCTECSESKRAPAKNLQIWCAHRIYAVVMHNLDISPHDAHARKENAKERSQREKLEKTGRRVDAGGDGLRPVQAHAQKEAAVHLLPRQPQGGKKSDTQQGAARDMVPTTVGEREIDRMRLMGTILNSAQPSAVSFSSGQGKARNASILGGVWFAKACICMCASLVH